MGTRKGQATHEPADLTDSRSLRSILHHCLRQYTASICTSLQLKLTVTPHLCRRAVPSGSMKRTTSMASEAARAKLASLARQTTEDINSRQTVPLPAEKVI